MGIAEDVRREIRQVLNTAFTTRVGYVVPEAEDVRLGNDAVKLKGTVLYADLSASTEMVDGYKDWFAAKMYKCFLIGACRMIRFYGGVITAFDGDRVMAVFIGNLKNSSAARASLAINWTTMRINQEVHAKYPNCDFAMNHTVGVDTSELFVARTGIRGSNDLVWVGRAANYAAKLSGLDAGYGALLTEDVYDSMPDSKKFSVNGDAMWQRLNWHEFNMTIYGSTWTWSP